MIEVYKFGPAFGLRETGPFVLKLMSYMRLAGVPFKEVIDGDTRKAPKKKLPYIKDGDVEMGDSAFIIKYLKSKYGDPLATGLTEAQLATGQAIKVMLEERTYWTGMIYPRWVKTDHHKIIADTFFKEFPSFIRMPIFRMIAKSVAKAARGHGIARHSDAEIYDLGLEDIKAVEDLLGDKAFIFGDSPAEVDATVFAFLHGMSTQAFPTPIQAYISGSEALMGYLERMEARVFEAEA